MISEKVIVQKSSRNHLSMIHLRVTVAMRHVRVHVRLRYSGMGGVAVALVKAGVAVLGSVGALVS